MTDDLRTRIVAALLSEDDVALMADAVIRKLGLTQERRHPIATEPGMTVGNWKIPTESRYVTDWTADD